MNISKIIAAGALATSLAVAQEDAWPADEQADASTSSATETENTASAPQKTNTLNSKMGVGVHADFNYSFLTGLAQDWYGGDDADAPSGIGFDVGIRGRIPMVQYLQFAPELNFHYALLTQEDETAEHTFSQIDLEFPLMVRGIVNDMFYIAAGVHLSLNLSSKVAFEEDGIDLGGGLGKTSIDYKEEIDQAAFSFGLAFGAGVYIMERLSIDVGFTIGLTDIYPDVDPAKNDLIDNMDGGKQMTFKAGVGFWIM